MDEANNSLLEVRDIVKEYILPRKKLFSANKSLRALDGVSLTLNYSESFGIVGESGSGKSTLARTILALESPQSGEICFKGKILHSLKSSDLRRIRRNIQMIFQDPFNSLDPRQNVGKIISEPLTLLENITIEKKQEKVADVLENVGLSPNDINKFPHEFSGGQRQRIAIARALITRPALIVADEPVSSLDLSVQAQVLNLMMDLRDKKGLAYLFISHDLNVVRQITTRVAVMYAGRIVETGSTENLFNRPLHPYTLSLLEAIPKPDPLRKIKKHKKITHSNLKNNNRTINLESGCSYASQCPFAEEKCKFITPQLENTEQGFSSRIVKNKKTILHKVACYNPLN